MAFIFQSLAMDFATVFVVLTGALYLYVTRHFDYWKKRGIPFAPPTPFVGNMKDLVYQKRSIGLQIKHLHETYNKQPFVGFFAFDEPCLLVRSIDLIRNVLAKDSHYFLSRSFAPSEAQDPLQAKNLFSLSGHKWRNLRAKLTPTFTSGKMKMMFNLVDAVGEDLTECLRQETLKGKPVAVRDLCARYTTDTIATCAFGIEAKSLQDVNSEFRKTLKKVFEVGVVQGLTFAAGFVAPRLVQALNLRMVDTNVTQYVRKTVWDVVEHRERNGITRKDFLDLMIQIKNKGSVVEPSGPGANMDEKTRNDDQFRLEGDDFVAQCFVFLAAGFETSSTTMGYSLYELALHPHYQTRLRDEITAVMARYDGKLTYDGLLEMKYLDMVVSETLRKYPPLPFLDRLCLQDYEIPGSGVTIPKGRGIFISMLGVHMDPELYPEPERYDPERFTEEAKRARPSFAYFPFGEGPRNCIGMRFGLMQTKTGLVHMLSRFSVHPCKQTPNKITYDSKTPILAPKTDIQLDFRPL